ncbi:hypothetical protein Q31b_50870 [Novipirellula aureliae]|uniref:Threonine transporter RhtB n=1 Tax=Novipirellula aureliae TaxID=2527966 RepID=A0A5C6DG92_9BACT|nr:ABC-three component system middle component 2 [Novipirellula aureliae]TWU35652.1 hypothetical protein Q31b_50870 [Novipirellula aureliae]
MSTGSNETTVSPFNSPVELGFRTLVFLNEAFPNEFSLRQLVIFDYLMVHSDDVAGGPEGLHPQTPYRSGELLVRREPLQAGIQLFHSRGLIEKLYRQTGVFFAASDRTESFLDVIEADYSVTLRNRASWVAETFGDKSVEYLDDFVAANLGKWGAEFEMASVLWNGVADD